MFDKLKQLTKETVIYGVSTILGRFLNFFLVPFYTNIFPPEDYGIITNIYAIIAILNIFFLFGLDSAYLKFATSEELKNKKVVFSVPTISILAVSLFLSMIMLVFRTPISSFLSLPQDFSIILYYTVLILLLDTLASLPFIHLRLENKAIKFTSIKMGNILINVILNLVLIVKLGWGIEAVFLSNLIASLFSFVMVLPVYFKLFSICFDKELFFRFLKFGLPYLPAGLASIFVQVIDRPIVEHLTNLKQLGIYQANYRLGIFMMLFVSMFQFAWQPFFLKNAREENAKEIFSKVLTYFTLIASSIFIFLSLYIEDIVKISFGGRHLIGSAYWVGLSIVPIVLFAYLLNGLHVIFSAGLYIKEKSTSVPIIMIISALVNILVNFALIPFFGILGAALATLASYLVMAIGYYISAQRLYYIKYEFKKMAYIFISLGVVAVLYSIIPVENMNILIKSLLLLGFVSLIFMFRVVKIQIKTR